MPVKEEVMLDTVGVGSHSRLIQVCTGAVASLEGMRATLPWAWDTREDLPEGWP